MTERKQQPGTASDRPPPRKATLDAIAELLHSDRDIDTRHACMIMNVVRELYINLARQNGRPT